MKYTFRIVSVLATIWTLSFAAQAAQEEEFIAALLARNFEEATRIYDQHGVDPSYRSVNEQSRDHTPLFVAAGFQQWDLVARMVRSAGANVNATPFKGPHRGRTPFGLVIAFRQPPLALRMFEMGGDVNVAIQEGADRGGTPLYVAAHRKLWSLVIRILLTRPEANLEVAPAERPQDTLERLISAPDAPKWVLTLYQFVRYLDPGRKRESPKDISYNSFRVARKPFLDALFGFIDPADPITTISGLPPEMRWELAEKAIFAQCPELKEVPAEFEPFVHGLIKRILKNEQTSFHAPSMTDANVLRMEAANLVAVRVLSEVYPIEARDPRKKEKVKKVRKWIVELLSRHLVDRVLEKEARRQLVSILSKMPFNKITRKWFSEQIFLFFHPQNVPLAMVEEPHAETKRAREDEEHDVSKLKIRIRRPKIEPARDDNLRDGLIRDVIRDAPGLNRDQVHARVDEIMAEGVEPMDVGDNATEVDPSELYRAAFHPAVMQRPCS